MTPYDLDQLFGEDVALTDTGDLSTVTGTALGEQRVYRRLMTNPGTYIWHPNYGAGLPRYVGTNLNILQLEGVIRAQIALESVVARQPVPVVDIVPILNGVVVTILWVDNNTGQQATLEFDLT